MLAALYTVGDDRKTREMEKHDGVAAKAGHGVLSAMAIYIPEQLTQQPADWYLPTPAHACPLQGEASL